MRELAWAVVILAGALLAGAGALARALAPDRPAIGVAEFAGISGGLLILAGLAVLAAPLVLLVWSCVPRDFPGPRDPAAKPEPPSQSDAPVAPGPPAPR